MINSQIQMKNKKNQSMDRKTCPVPKSFAKRPISATPFIDARQNSVKDPDPEISVNGVSITTHHPSAGESDFHRGLRTRSANRR